MSVGALGLLLLLLYPWQPASLPSRAAQPGSPRPAPPAAAQRVAGPRPSLAETAALFSAPRPAARPVPAAPLAVLAPLAPLQRVPWLHFVAFVVGSDGQTTFFFKNDQTGRVLMLASGEAKDGWRLAAIQGDACVLENGGSRYLVTRR